METLRQVLTIIFYILNVYLYYMITVIILSWIPGIYEQRWYQVLRKTVDWYMGRFRGLLVVGQVDFTPILGFILYEAAIRGLYWIIISL